MQLGKIRSLGWVLIQCAWYLYEKEKFGHRYEKENDVKDAGGGHHTEAKERSFPHSLEGRNPAHTLSPNLCCPALEIVHFCCFSHSVCGVLFGQSSETREIIKVWTETLVVTLKEGEKRSTQAQSLSGL